MTNPYLDIIKSEPGPIFDLNPYAPIVLDIRHVLYISKSDYFIEVLLGTIPRTFSFSSIEQTQHFYEFLLEAKRQYVESTTETVDYDNYIAHHLQTIEQSLKNHIDTQLNSLTDTLITKFDELSSQSLEQLSSLPDTVDSLVKSHLTQVPATLSRLSSQMDTIQGYIHQSMQPPFDTNWSPLDND